MNAVRFLATGLLVATGLSISSPILGQTLSHDYQVLLDVDRDTTTGCSITPTSGAALDGFEHRLLATVEVSGGTATVVSLDRQDCSGTSFGASQPLSAPAAAPYGAALDTGLSGSDALELAVLRSEISALFSTGVRLVFVADNGSGSDVLATTDGSTPGGAIVLGMPVEAEPIPLFSWWGIALLLIAVVLLGWLAQRRMGRIASVGMIVLVAGLAWAMHLVLDGDLSDWGGLSPAGQDATGDATDGSSANDLFAGFAAFENDTLYFRIDVVDMENSAPSASADSYATDEDTALNEAAPGVLANDSDPESDPLTAVLDSGPANAASFTLNADGSFDYTPAADFNGSDSFSYHANDGQADSVTVTVTLTVNAVNDAPTAQDDTATTNEDVQVDIDVLANDSDVDGNLDPATVNVTTPPANGSTSVNATNGVITYTKAVDFNGSDSFVYEVCDDGTPTPAECASATVSITVDAVNDAPTFTGGGDVSSDEDAGAQTVPAWATNIDDGDDGTQTLAFNVTNNTNTALFSAGPAIDATSGDLAYTAAADANGSADITVELTDDGGTANGGVDTSAPVTFTITINAVNDAPTFTASDPAAVLEDAGAQSISGWASFDPGPADEAGQSVVAYSVSNVSNPGLFSAVPSVDASGNLSYTPAPDANGSSTFDVSVQDDGGTANGGQDTSATTSFTVTINAVNDAPSFTASNPPAVDEDAGAQNVGGWASFDPGPANEGGQSVQAYLVTNVSNPGLFSAGPSVDNSGTLSYTPATNANGSATFDVSVQDDGGTPNGGVDTSPTQNFTITVNAVDDPPTAVDDTATITEDDPATTINVLANDTDPDGGSNAITTVSQPANGTVVITNAGADLTYEPNANYCNDGSPTDDFTYTLNGGSAATVAVTVTCVNDPPTVSSPISYAAIGNTLLRVPGDDGQHAGGVPGRVASSSDATDAFAKASVSDVDDTPAFVDGTYPTIQGGAVTIDADGDFHYTPPIGFTGSDSVDIDVTDGTNSVPVTFNFTVSDMIWYVEDTTGTKNPVGNSDGRSTDAFETLAAAEAASGENDIILVMETDSPLDEGITLKSGQKLYGQRVEEEPMSLLPAGLLLEEIADTNARPQIHRTSGNTVTVDATAASMSDVEIRHLDLQSGNEDAIEVTTAGTNVATVVIDENIMNAGNAGVDVNGGHTAGISHVTLTDNVITSFNAGVNVAQFDTGLMDLGFGNHAITSTDADAVFLDGLFGGGLRVISLGNLTVDGATNGTGFRARGVIFDAAPDDGDFSGDTVTAGSHAIGTSGDPVGSAGVFLSDVSGDLAYGDLDVFANGTGLDVSGSGVFNAGAGTGFRLTTPAGSNVSGSTGVVLDPLTADVTFDTVIASGGTYGVSLTDVAGTFTASGGSLTNQVIAAFHINGGAVGSLSSTYGGTITQGANNARAVNIESLNNGSATFNGAIVATDGTGIRIANNSNTVPVAFNAPVDLGTGASRLSDGTALSFTGNSPGTTVTAPDIDVFTAGQTALNASGNGTLDLDALSIDTASNGRALDMDGILSLVAVDTVNCSHNANCVDLTSLAASSLTTFAGVGLNCSAGTCFNAISARTVEVFGSGNTVSATNAAAVNLANTTIGANGVTFESVSASGAANGVILDSTGSTGTFSVTGNGSTSGSGGTLQNITGDAITLNNTGSQVSLAHMIIQDIGSTSVVDSEHDAIHGATVQGGLVLDGMVIRRVSDMAIHGAAFPNGDSATSWNGLTITNSTIENTNRYHVAGEGDTSDEGGVRIVGLQGTVLVDGNTFQNTGEHLDLFAISGSLDLTAINNNFYETYKEFSSGSIASVGKICVDVTVQSAANANVVIGGSAQANAFRNCRIASVRVANDAGATGTITSTVANNSFVVTDHSSGSGGDFDFPMAGVKYSTRGATSATFDGRITGNTFTDVTNADGGVGNVTLDMDQGNIQVLVDSNVFHAPGNAAWFVRADATSSFNLAFDSNTYERDAFPCTADPSCGGGYFGPGLFNRTQIQNGGVLDVTYLNEGFAQHDTSFDPGNTVEVQVLNVGGGGTACASFANNTSPHGYALEESAGTLNLALGVSALGLPATCSGGAPANCVTVLGDNGNTGGGGNAAATPPTVSVFGTVDIVGSSCALPTGGIF